MKPFIATLVILTLVIALYQLPPPAPSNPNKHILPAYGNAAALFAQMGAYRGSPFAFAVVASPKFVL
ncbi:hypothetical protein MRB53_009361 [Persea americana]|uniref:Uncharacterized protein n=1 Tax=Persea americana TaxID=3435 RepID=A0ACC2LNT3_PERAE|nr:hypothetical protein MRB53_009361 [Persea americana]